MTPSIRYPNGILATCCIPWTSHLQFDEAQFRRHVREQISAGFVDLYIFGTAGEGYGVTERQFDAITRAFVDETEAGGGRAMVGIISLALSTIIERIERAREWGVRRFQLSLPSWGRLNDSEVAAFFAETCGRFQDCEFLHYNLSRAGRVLTGEEYGRLSARHANLVATKNSTADEHRLNELFLRAPDLRHFITELGFAKAALMAECGLLVSIASIHPGLARRYFAAGQRRDAKTLQEMSDEIQKLISALRSSVQHGAHMDGAFDKMFCRVRDRDFPLRLQAPYMGVDESEFDTFVNLLHNNHSKWLEC